MQPSLVSAAATALRELIIRGGYAPGDRLPSERELADGLGVSRAALREAIRLLTDAGLLTPRRGSGTYVAEVDLDSVFDVRERLEPFAAARAAALRSTAELRRLESLLRELERSIGDPHATAATDVEIHRVIARASGNPVLARLLEQLTELVQLSRAVTSTERAGRQAAARDLRALVRAVRERDESAAAQAMETHLRTIREVARHAQPRDRTIVRLPK
jgi:GntR family transcriptional repressor for pyruvate dehydrogenase complex